MEGVVAYILIGLGIAIALYMAWNVGANDVANAMGTSVGSKSLTFRQAIIIAAIFEFAGAFLLGGSVSDTIRKGIVDPSFFAGEPVLLALGMIAALLAAAVCLNGASLMGMPISTTHAIVGAVAGFGIIEFGGAVVSWGTMGAIVLSWFVSPLCGAFLGYFMFVLIRKLILDKEDPEKSVLSRIPYLLFIVFSILIFSVFKKGAKNLFAGRIEAPTTTEALVASIVLSVIVTIVAVLLIRRGRTNGPRNGDPYEYVEGIFRYLQIITACYVALAHGANDVANAVGPLAAVLHIVRTGSVEMQVAMPSWVLALGGLGIVAGLATFGYRVMMTVGTKIIELSPSRGFAAEFGAATTVLVCSMWGLPISTTHTLVGAVAGVGFARGMEALNYRVLYSIGLSWLVTVPVAATFSVVIYSVLKFIFA